MKVRLLACALLCVPAIAAAQPRGEEDFHREVIDRLDRIERLLRDERRYGGGYGRPDSREETEASVNTVCGVNADCLRQAQDYCRRAGYERGVAARTETRGPFIYMVRVRCFN